MRLSCIVFYGCLASIAFCKPTIGTADAARQTRSPARPRMPASPLQVLIVMNVRSADSRSIVDRYTEARHIPVGNILRISCPESDEWTIAEFRSELETFVQQRVRDNPAIDYVVLTRGIPFRFSDFGTDGGYATDSILSTCAMAPRPAPHSKNPYFRANASFSRARFGLLLVTRLDGPSKATAFREIESSLNAGPSRGPFYLRDSFIESMESANAMLTARGLATDWVKGANNPAFPHYEGLKGPYTAHWGAGPHDTQFTDQAYTRLKFLPGALGDLTWSASAAGLRNETSIGNIAIMSENGAAGVQGYVSEPFSDALSKPEIVLERYTRGYNLAESFSMGTPWINWKQLVLGDPLCSPYTAY